MRRYGFRHHQLLIHLAIVVCLLCLPIWEASGESQQASVVFSEVCVNGTEYVELYNQTDQAISLEGWSLCYYSASRASWNDPLNRRQLPAGTLIQAYSYLLVSLAPDPDWHHAVTPDLFLDPRIRASDASGTLALFSAESPTEIPVDAIAWGSAQLAEGEAADEPPMGEILCRAFVAGSRDWVLMDTNNNLSDFTYHSPTPSSSRSGIGIRLASALTEIRSDAANEIRLLVRNAGTESASLELATNSIMEVSCAPPSGEIALLPQEVTEVALTLFQPPIRYTILDLETTGFSRTYDEIIEIAWASFEDGQCIETFSALICPSARISGTRIQAACDFTNIPIQELKSAQPAGEVLPGAIAPLAGQTLVYHSCTKFDEQFLQAEALRNDILMPDIDWVDSCLVAREAFPDLERHSLGYLSEHFEIALDHHRALSDAIATGLIYWKSLQQLGSQITVRLADSASRSIVATLGLKLPVLPD